MGYTITQTGPENTNTMEFAFIEKEHGNYFPVRKTTDPYALEHGLTHELVCCNGLWTDREYTRFCKPLKTVCYVATDENPDGSPKLEKWKIRRV